MKKIESLEQLISVVAEVRAKRKGFITNFYLDEIKHGLWIKKGICYYKQISDTIFIIKKSDTFWNVFYCTTTPDAFIVDIDNFRKSYSEETMMFDIVGRDTQCHQMVELFNSQGFLLTTSLVRMTRMTEQTDYTPEHSVKTASSDNVKEINLLLHKYFDEKTEQLPFVEELEEYAKQGHILICNEDNNLAGFLIYEMNTTTLYLRYWFTHPDYRDKKVGSRLLRRFFEEGKETKRQIFWVKRDNENAIKRYKHYGFVEENMFDYVMSNKQ